VFATQAYFDTSLTKQLEQRPLKTIIPWMLGT